MPRLFILDLAEGRVFSVKPEGSDKKIIAAGGRLPDGIVVDVEAEHVYWTNMGIPSRNDGSIERCGLDGRNRTTIVPEGVTFTPKQLQLDKRGPRGESGPAVRRATGRKGKRSAGRPYRPARAARVALPRVVIAGGGFGGLAAAQALRKISDASACSCDRPAASPSRDRP